MHVVTTAQAVRVKGVWVGRTDAGLARPGPIQPATALARERIRRRRTPAEARPRADEQAA